MCSDWRSKLLLQLQIYSAEPLTNITDPAQQVLVLGGEATVWSERLDPSVALAVAFPRAAAIAERLWSPRSVTNASDARVRFGRFRTQLLALGIPASTLDGGNEATAWGLPSRPAGPGPN
jgi:hexosaminidase